MTLKQQIRKAETELNKLLSEQQKRERREQIPCAACESTTRLDKITFYQQEYYVAPYSCNGGDYWSPSDYGYWVCKCGVANRLSETHHPKLWQRLRAHADWRWTQADTPTWVNTPWEKTA